MTTQTAALKGWPLASPSLTGRSPGAASCLLVRDRTGMRFSLPETGDLADGVIFNVLGGPIPELSATGAIARRFSSAYGLEPNRYGIDVYQEVHLCAEAMTIAGSPDDHLSVGTCLGLAKKDMAEGTLSFDPRTHLARCAADAVPMRWFQFSGARPVCLAPSHLATGSFTVPAWLA